MELFAQADNLMAFLFSGLGPVLVSPQHSLPWDPAQRILAITQLVPAPSQLVSAGDFPLTRTGWAAFFSSVPQHVPIQRMVLRSRFLSLLGREGP